MAGRIFYEAQESIYGTGQGRWVYEAFNHCISSTRVERETGGTTSVLSEALCGLFSRSETETINQARDIREARARVIANEEERRIQAAVSAAKKKNTGGAGGNKGGKKDAEEEKKDDDNRVSAPVRKDLDLFNKADFGQALKEQVLRPFVFGPIEFTGLDEPAEDFPAEFWHDAVVNAV